jgi:hypothetical protein
MFDNIVDLKQPFLLPHEVTELDSKSKQVLKKISKLFSNIHSFIF